MTIDQLIKTLADKTISLTLHDEELVIRGPEENLTDELKALITTHRFELIERLKQAPSAAAPSPSTTIPPIPISQNGHPLSWFQERLWVFNQKDPDDLSYNVPIIFTVEGNLNVEALEKSLNAIVGRHESMRTIFEMDEDGEIRQFIEPLSPIRLTPIAVSEAEAGPIIDQTLSHVFDLETGPLFAAKLLRIQPEKHIFLFTIHHICSDAWSNRGIFFKELRQCYAAYCRGEEPALAPLKIQYKDFATWQRKQDISNQLPYWQKSLEGYEDTLKMPTDFPRHPKSGRTSETFTRIYSKEFSASLERFSQRHQCTLFISLLAGFGLTVSRYTGRDDVCIGTTVAGRSLVELEPLIGFLVNILPLRIQIDEDMNVKAYMEQIRQLTLDGFDNQMVAFEQILYSLDYDHRGKTNALVPLVLRHQNFPHTQMDRPLPDGVRFTPYTSDNADGNGKKAVDIAARCEMELSYTGNGDNLELSIAYASDMYTRETIDRVLDRHQHILEEMFANENAGIKDLSILDENDIKRLCVTYNQTDAPLAEGIDIIARFDAQATKTPKSIACFDREGEWRYAEIAAGANRLAHGLIEKGIRPGDLVGVSLERGAPLLISLLAIWKAGGAYVPLDPAYPNGYLQQMIKDANPKLVVCTSAVWEKLNATNSNAFLLDLEKERLAALPTTAPNVTQAERTLAYLMYTSGSTGIPKGVRVPHLQLQNWLGGLEAKWPFEAGEVIAQKTTMAFAVSVKELFAGLVNGCAEVFFDSDTVQDTAAFVETLAKYKVSRLNLVPSHLMTVLDYLQRQGAALPSLKYCITAGEPLTTEMVSAFRARLPHATLLNNYGCTELNDIAYFDTTGFEADGGFVPIGRPIQNTKVYVLDRQGRLVPEGVEGELHVATLGMSEGYHNMPAMTAERYVKNPFNDSIGSLLYNTGDVVKYLSDGNLEFIGRWDFQVKVRGFRVDVRQVEKVLGDFPGMGTRAVAGDGDRLIAFYTSPDGSAVDVNALRNFLQKQLPPYMVPDAFVKLDAMPKLPNGKLNRRALKTTEGQLQQSDGYEAPETRTERALAHIWAEVLELPVEEIGRHAHFFEIGGHSLAATRVVARLKDRLQVEIGLSKVFALPRLKDLGERIDELSSAAADDETKPTTEWTLRIDPPEEQKASVSKMLDNKVCLVTGASRGIGESIARLLAAHGAKVAVNFLQNEGLARKVKAQIEREGGIAEVFQGDVTNVVQVKRMVDAVRETLGPIDVLVANASIRFKMMPFVEYEWGDFERKVSDELKAMFYPCQAVVPEMMKRRSGSIIAISSGLSKHTGDGFVAHSTAKAALDSFVRALAHEVGPSGVRVNTVAPGVVLTDATANFTPERKEDAASAVPLRRNALPHDIAGAVLFLATDLSQYMTGCYIPVDGGFTML